MILADQIESRVYLTGMDTEGADEPVPDEKEKKSVRARERGWILVEKPGVHKSRWLLRELNLRTIDLSTGKEEIV